MFSTLTKASLGLLLLGALPACLNASHEEKVTGNEDHLRATGSATVGLGAGAYSYSWSGEQSKNKGFTDGAMASSNEPYTVTVNGANASAMNGATASPPPPPPPAPVQLAEKPQVKMPDKIIKTGSLEIEVDDYKKARVAVDEAVRAQGGYIQHEDETGDHYATRNNLSIRVPSGNFDKLMSGLSGIAKEVRGRTVNMADVSEEYYDLEARKKAQEAAALRYIELLKQAKTVSEVMEIQAKIDEIQEEVEAKAGRIRYLSDQVSYSTISLGMTKNYEYKPTDSPNFLSRVGSAFGNGWQGVLHFLVGVVQLWPMWLVLAVIAWFLRKLIKRWRKKPDPAPAA